MSYEILYINKGTDDDNINVILDWIEENSIHDWKCDAGRYGYGSGAWVFWFKHEWDVVAFKLRWL